MKADRSAGRITALTFDFWNTLYSADHGALDDVRPRRRASLAAMLSACGVATTEEALDQAYRLSFEAYLAAWNQGIHFGAHEQVRFMMGHFGMEAATVPDTLINETARAVEDASLAAPLVLLPGVRETLPRLAADGYVLGLISDTSLTPGRILRLFLEKDGLLHCFRTLTFSDITGYTKPDRRMFEQTLAGMGVRPEHTAHVGDTPRTDIAGAQAMGMVAIRCAAAADHDDPPAADFVIRDHREIPKILCSLAR